MSRSAGAWRAHAWPLPASLLLSCTAFGATAQSSAGAGRSQRPQQPHDERSSSFRLTKADPRRSRGDDGRGDLVASLEPEGSNAPKVAGQIETPRPPDPIMRRPRADREEKRVTHGRDMRNEDRLDPGNPNQRRLLDMLRSVIDKVRNLYNISGPITDPIDYLR